MQGLASIENHNVALTYRCTRPPSVLHPRKKRCLGLSAQYHRTPGSALKKTATGPLEERKTGMGVRKSTNPDRLINSSFLFLSRSNSLSFSFFFSFLFLCLSFLLIFPRSFPRPVLSILFSTRGVQRPLVNFSVGREKSGWKHHSAHRSGKRQVDATKRAEMETAISPCLRSPGTAESR
ncbi:hypothetical protein HDV62DRAFT_110178 [Trichoderma sp. SZMC 28011]